MVVSFCQDIYQILCKKYPDRKIYIIGDHHFYHKNIINYTRSSFIDVYEMNKYIIKMHNEIVGSDEIVIFLGDFCFKNSLIVDVLKQMNGHKYLIMGNHDSECLLKNYKSMGVRLSLSKNVVPSIIKLCDYETFGARGVDKVIEDRLESLIVDQILLGNNFVKIAEIEAGELV